VLLVKDQCWNSLLAKLTIEGFRKLNILEMEFRRGLNVFVGPNNVCKTAAVDALRAQERCRVIDVCACRSR